LSYRLARFYRQGGEQARFDQQPVEAAGRGPACLQAYAWLETLIGAMRLVGFQLVSRDNDLSFLSTMLKPRLPGRLASRPRQSKSRTGIHAVFLMALLEMRSLQNLNDRLKGWKTLHDAPGTTLINVEVLTTAALLRHPPTPSCRACIGRTLSTACSTRRNLLQDERLFCFAASKTGEACRIFAPLALSMSRWMAD